MNPISIAIHGGAGTLVKGMMTPEKETAYKTTLQLAVDQGYAILVKGRSAVDAVEAAVVLLENTPLFNAGKGSVFTVDKYGHLALPFNTEGMYRAYRKMDEAAVVSIYGV